MKPAPFLYYRATSLEDAIAHLDDADTAVRPLAGGQSLVPMLNLRLAPAEKLVDLGRIESLKLAAEKDGEIWYGALVPHAAFEDRRVPDCSNGLMPYIGGQIAYRAIRTRGTIGGAISLADPAADWLTAAIALEAKIALVGPKGRRTLAASEFVTGTYMTALDHAELVEAIVVPRRPESERWGHYKAARKIGEYADSMAIALFDPDTRKARLVLGAASGAPLVLDRAAAEIGGGADAARLSLAIRDDLTSSGRSFSPAKLHLHNAVALRAIKNAGLL
jgi:aerobic carbon-monoxide dehydrogenase medium subunit